MTTTKKKEEKEMLKMFQRATVAERIDKISVFGGLDQVLNGLVKMR